MTADSRLLLVVPPLMQSTPALERAGALARVMGAHLHVVAFDYLDALATAGLVNEEVRSMLRHDYVRHHQAWLEQQVTGLRNLGSTVTTEVVWTEHPMVQIMVHVNEAGADLVIKDIEHDSLLRRSMFTPLDLRLLHACRAPLHFVAACQQARPRRIVAAVDLQTPADEQFPGFNDQLIYAALKLGVQCQAQVELVYAYDLSAVDALQCSDAWATAWLTGELPTTRFDRQQQAFDELAERNGVAVEHRHLLLGNPAKVLARFANEHDIDVVFLGRKHSRRPRHFLGSTTERLLYRLAGSLWVISPEAALH